MVIEWRTVMVQALLALGVLLLTVVVVAAVQLVLILRKMLRTADSVARMADMTERELTPMLHGVSRSTESISKILGRLDKVASVFLVKFDVMAEGAEHVKGQASRFMKSPISEVQSWVAGIRRGLEVFVASRGRNGGDKNA